MIFTIPVLLYQLLLVAILWIAHRFGRLPLLATAVVCLIWTATHLFFIPLAVLQATVILVTSGLLLAKGRKSASSRPQE